MRQTSNEPNQMGRGTAPGSQASSVNERLGRIFNTALISSAVEQKEDFSEKLVELTQSPAFRAILRSVHDLAMEEGISEKEAAEKVIRAFRDAEQIWSQYVFAQGVDLLKKGRA